MSGSETNPLEPAPLKIGALIEAELRRQQRTVAWFSRRINCDRRNVYDIFSRTYIDTGLLFHISRILNHDFFRYYSDALPVLSREDAAG